MRAVKVAATAWSWGTPAAVMPAMRPASITPRPPGTGAIPPMTDARELMTMSCMIGSEAP